MGTYLMMCFLQQKRELPRQWPALERDRESLRWLACCEISCCVCSSWIQLTRVIDQHLYTLSLSISVLHSLRQGFPLDLNLTHTSQNSDQLFINPDFLVIHIAKLLYMISNHSVALCSDYIATLRIILCKIFENI